MDRVDWTIDEPVDCKHCDYSLVTSENTKRLTCLNTPGGRGKDTSVNIIRKYNINGCGPEGKLFKRRNPTDDDYDFINNPPPLMNWIED